MSERHPMREKDWRNLSARISPEIEAGLDLDGLTDLLSTKQRRMFSLPKEFRVHKYRHGLQLLLTTDALGLYGELDRAVAGLLPLQQLPVEQHVIAHYSTFNAAIDTTYFYCLRAGRQDLVQALQAMQDVSVRYHTIVDFYLEEKQFESLLDFSEEEIHDRRHWTKSMWMEMYIKATGPLAKVYLLGGSRQYPQDWLLNEIRRYADKVFSTPGYEPFSEHAYGLKS